MIISAKYVGGLGNQLFQIFNMISLSIDYKAEFYLLNKSYSDSVFCNRVVYWDNLFNSLRNILKDDKFFRDENFILFNEKDFSYNKIALPINNNIMLEGYFQSYKYFIHNYDYILDILDFNKIQLELLNKYISKYDFNQLNSIHFRLGDYKKLPDCHPIMNMTYYMVAIKNMIEQTKICDFLIFYEKEDYDIVLNNCKFIKSSINEFSYKLINTDIPDYEQMLCMSLCQNNIIANSSFSWWGAFLNKSKTKTVIYPSNWFGPKININSMTDMFPETWIKI
jgi:hypothetical protein